jgi:polysaccharide biosynthesis/export protein
MPILAMEQAQPIDVPTTRPESERPASDSGQPEQKYVIIDGKPVLVGSTQPADKTSPTPEPVPAPAAAAIEKDERPTTQPAYEFGGALNPDLEKRVIRIPMAPFRNGDLRYNIVIRPGDMIIVPSFVQTFYYMGGHVGQPGAFSLAGQKITLTQAVIAARMLDPLAVPAKTDIIRRIGPDKQVFVRVNLEKIFEGRHPDIFLKSHDQVLVGTDIYPVFLHSLRNAFRVTYGFGFLYDRNYAPQQRVEN